MIDRYLWLYLFLIQAAYYGEGLIPRICVVSIYLINNDNFHLTIALIFIGTIVTFNLIKAFIYFRYEKTLMYSCRDLCKIDIYIDAIFEEIIWRDIIYKYIIEYANNPVLTIVLIFIFSFLFVYIHKVQEKNKNIEMFVFTLLIWISYFAGNGLHYGVHIARNLFVDILNENSNL